VREPGALHLSPRILAFLLPVLLLPVACEDSSGRESWNPTFKEPMVNGYLYKVEFFDFSIEYSTDFEVVDNDGLRMVPVVSLNGSPVEVYSYGYTEYRYGHSNPIPVYSRYELDVRHFWGSAFCRVVMPADFRVTSPPPDYILGRESTLVSTWRSSAGSQWYWASLYVDYDYYDSTGSWDNYTFTLDTLVYDTFIRVGPERIFPPFVAEIIEGDGTAMVWAGNGPAIEPGDLNNVRGVGFGFVNAINEPRERYFFVGAPPAGRRVPGMREAKDRFIERLRRRNHGE
jgi:hypothetical protein